MNYEFRNPDLLAESAPTRHSVLDMFEPTPLADLQPGHVIARGVCRFLIDSGHAPVTEFTPTPGLRVDVATLGRSGEIWVIECKSSLADFRADRKWQGYLDWCDRFFFAVPEEFPDEVLPPEEGLIRADGFSADKIRDAQPRPLAAARRRALTLRIGRAAALRLRAGIDPKPPR